MRSAAQVHSGGLGSAGSAGSRASHCGFLLDAGIVTGLVSVVTEEDEGDDGDIEPTE